MSKRVLIIDDEEHIRRMMRLTLEAAGYEVGEAKDGTEGIKLFDKGSKGCRNTGPKNARAEWSGDPGPTQTT